MLKKRSIWGPLMRKQANKKYEIGFFILVSTKPLKFDI